MTMSLIRSIRVNMSGEHINSNQHVHLCKRSRLILLQGPVHEGGSQNADRRQEVSILTIFTKCKCDPKTCNGLGLGLDVETSEGEKTQD